MRRNICCARPEISANQSGGIANSAFAVGRQPSRSQEARSSISSNMPSPDLYAAQTGVAVLVSRTIAAIANHLAIGFAAELIAAGKPVHSRHTNSNTKRAIGVPGQAWISDAVCAR